MHMILETMTDRSPQRDQYWYGLWDWYLQSNEPVIRAATLVRDCLPITYVRDIELEFVRASTKDILSLLSEATAEMGMGDFGEVGKEVETLQAWVQERKALCGRDGPVSAIFRVCRQTNDKFRLVSAETVQHDFEIRRTIGRAVLGSINEDDQVDIWLSTPAQVFHRAEHIRHMRIDFRIEDNIDSATIRLARMLMRLGHLAKLQLGVDVDHYGLDFTVDYVRNSVLCHSVLTVLQNLRHLHLAVSLDPWFVHSEAGEERFVEVVRRRDDADGQLKWFQTTDLDDSPREVEVHPI